MHICLICCTCFAQGEDQKKLDVLANEVFINMLAKSGQCAVIVSMDPCSEWGLLLHYALVSFPDPAVHVWRKALVCAAMLTKDSVHSPHTCGKPAKQHSCQHANARSRQINNYALA